MVLKPVYEQDFLIWEPRTGMKRMKGIPNFIEFGRLLLGGLLRGLRRLSCVVEAVETFFYAGGVGRQICE